MRPNPSKTVNTGKLVPKSPLVSVIIPVYNNASFIDETLASAFAQTFENFEVIVINDGSPDTPALERVIKPYLEKIVYIVLENVGAGAARNFGIEESRGKLIAFLDGDDIWLPEYLASQVEFLDSNGYDLVYSDAVLFGGSPLDGTNYMAGTPSEGEANFTTMLDYKCNAITSGTIVKKSRVIEAGLFEWEKVRAHDLLLWLRIAENNAKIGYQKRVLLKYRVRIDSLSGDSQQIIQREIDAFNRILDKFELDKFHRTIVKNQLFRLTAELEIERGKSFLLQENFVDARSAFENGNLYRQSWKLDLIILLLKLAPRPMLRFYKSFRSGEIAFLSQN